LMFHSIFDFMPVIFQILYSLIFIFVISWKVGLVFMVFIPIFLVYTHKVALHLQPLRKTYHQYFEQASGKLGEMVINVRTVKDFTWETAERKQFEDYLRQYQENIQKRVHFEEKHSMYRDILMQIGRVLTLGFSVYLVYTGEITAGSLVLIVTLNEKASASISRIGKTYNYVGDSISGVRRILDLMDKEPEVEEKKDATRSKLKGAIEFKHVDFSYVGGEKVLQDINLDIRPKETVAIVGRSGCGKSTLIKLLYRHFDVLSGQILLDGTDIRDCRFDSFRSQMAIVSQDVELFNATIYENITYGTRKPKREDVIKAAKLAYAHDFIANFTNGYETIVGEKGVKLSGGQKQRIGIARALLRKPAILIFDEATSSLDTESERTIQKAMQKLFKKQTMIVIAHRLSTIENADKIVVLEDGRITEQGSHQELMQKGGIFRRMRKLQAMGEIR
ncbi:MAG: ABC transporter ATP-binding protein, partial [Nanobdellota archaeon]